MSDPIFEGIAASPGTGIGKIFLMEEEKLVIEKRAISKDELKKEIQRFRRALSRTEKDLKQDRQEMLKALGKSHARLADTYLMILEDPLLTKDVEKEISKELVNAEFAVQSCLEKISRSFESLTDEYFRERMNEILEVGNKILRHLLSKKKKSLAEMKEESVIVAHNLLPSDTAALKSDLILGFAIDVGGKTSHTAILAQELGIPAVVGLKDITSRVNSGQTMIVDGNVGRVFLDPSAQTLELYKKEKEMQEREIHALKRLKDLPAQTLDGRRIELSANIEIMEDVKNVHSFGAEGIGLFRTEYLFMNRTDLPTEQEQVKHYTRVLKQVHPYPVIFRTLDVGGDKLAPFIDGYLEERNPFMGLRGLRFSLKYPEIFRVQLRALLRASSEGKIKIMFPMVSSVHEFSQAKSVLEAARNELLSEKEAMDPKLEVGAMIEVPSAALTADHLAQEADFFSIGTNDLIQYTMAVDRVNENVASLYEPMHHSILRLVKMVTDAAHAHGKWVGMCGEMAADPTFTQLLLGLDLDELSVVPAILPKLKQIIRSTSYQEAKILANEVLSAEDHLTAKDRLTQVKPTPA